MTYEGEKVLAIITSAQCEDGRGRAEGKTILTLCFCGTAESNQGIHYYKKYFFDTELPAELTRDFLNMGFNLTSAADVTRVAEQLIGRIARIAFVDAEGGRRWLRIDKYMGSDDPRKYAPQIDRKQE